jgi:hypothetical protein
LENRFDENAPLYMQVSLSDLGAASFGHPGNRCPGSTVLVQAAGLEECHKELLRKNVSLR